MGVKFTDSFRYCLVVEDGKPSHHSQTSEVTAYYLPAEGTNGPLAIIDTPGFGDTSGINVDVQIMQKIEDYFKNEMDTISAVCFVVKGSETRLTAQ